MQQTAKVAKAKRRRATPPSLVASKLRPHNAKWLTTQQRKARKHARDAAAHAYGSG